MDLTAKEFEQLLCEFCKQDLPLNFTVEHDIKDIGGESGNKRQIDTKIKGRIGISNILICGEAKNWNEPVGSETIDGLVGKYMSGEIRANKVLLFSNQGFTEPAIIRGKFLGIELLEPNDIGSPFKCVPHIVGMGYLGQMDITTIKSGPQYSEIPINIDDYIIIKGAEKISLVQNICRIVVSKLRMIINKNIYSDLSSVTIDDMNVLYEIKGNEGYRYDATFEVKVSIEWDYFFESLPTGVLRHLNTNEIRFVNMQGNPFEVLNHVLLSSTKGNYEQREDCIKNIVEKNIGHTLQLCIVDPDRNKTNPDNPILVPV